MDSVTNTYWRSTTTNASISSTKATTYKNLHSTHGATVTFKALWSVNTYYISYSYIGSGSTPVTFTETTSATFDSVFSITAATRVGYTFHSWNISNMTTDCTHYYGTTNAASTSGGSAATMTVTSEKYFKNLASSGTVYFTAVWVAHEYNISYAMNTPTGATITTTISTPATATFDTQYTVSTPAVRGYTFAGWNVTGMSTDCAHEISLSSSKINQVTGSSYTTAGATVYIKNLHSSQSSTGTVTFTATWMPTEFTIYYHTTYDNQ